MKDETHLQMLEILKKSNSKLLLSGYDNELYNSKLKDWFVAAKETTAQMGLHRTEKLWMNFNPGIMILD